MKFKKTPVDQVHFGAYVAELDRPWTETPFMFQGFVLRNDKQLDALKKYCQHVFIDPEREDSELIQKHGPPPTAAASVRGSTVYQEMKSVEAELPRAVAVHERSTLIVRQVSRAVQQGSVLDSGQTREAVSQITDSVVRNPDAMTLLARLQEKSGETLDRAVEVSVMMTVFGRFLQLPRDRLDTLSMLGLLQDVGKLKLPTEMLHKKTPLTPEEREQYKTHVNFSTEILSQTAGLPAEIPGLASLHHECFDGSGYPRGIRGNAIPLIGGIAAIADAYDSLTGPPPFGQQLTPSKALSFIYRERGKLFHPALVEQFIQCIGVFPVGSTVELNSGEVGIVVAQNPVRRLQPRVMVVRDAQGNPLKPYKMLDLMKDPKVSADEVYRIRKTLEFDAVAIDPKEMFL